MATKRLAAFSYTHLDENNLYALVTVTDGDLDDTSENAHEQDSVEFFINESHQKLDGYEEGDAQSVSYIHLDVYKRQIFSSTNWNWSIKS